jgi:hypothetical protein
MGATDRLQNSVSSLAVSPRWGAEAATIWRRQSTRTEMVYISQKGEYGRHPTM